MKQLIIFFFLALTISFSNIQEVLAQPEPNNSDTIDNKIRIQFINAVNQAIIGDSKEFRSFFTNTPGASDQFMTNELEEVYKICQPALAYYKDDKIQVVSNTTKKIKDYQAIQSVEIITIHTDTTKGIYLPGTLEPYKHMTMEIEWIRQKSGIWKIQNLNRKLWD